MRNREKFISERFVTCECGYNNRKGRLDHYGTCLCCGKILDPKSYLKFLVRQKQARKSDLLK